MAYSQIFFHKYRQYTQLQALVVFKIGKCNNDFRRMLDCAYLTVIIAKMAPCLQSTQHLYGNVVLKQHFKKISKPVATVFPGTLNYYGLLITYE